MSHNWIQETVASAPGVGDIPLGGAYSAKYLPFSVRVADGEMIECSILDGANREIGLYTYNAGANSLERSIIHETFINGVLNVSSPAAVDLSAAAVVACTGSAQSQVRPAPAYVRGASAEIIQFNPFGSYNSASAFTVANRAQYSAGWIPVRRLITRIGMRVGMADAASIDTRIALYAVAADGRPGQLLADSGHIDISVTGLKLVTLTEPIELQPGIYYTGLKSDSLTATFYKASTGWSPSYQNGISIYSSMRGRSLYTNDVIGEFQDDPLITNNSENYAWMVGYQ